MKRTKAMSILLTLAMIASLAPWAVLPARAATTVNVDAAYRFGEPKSESMISGTYCYKLENGTTYQLTNNVTINYPLFVGAGQTVTLDLNGHTLSRSVDESEGIEYGCAIIVMSSNQTAVLTLEDSSDNKNTVVYDGTGKITGGNSKSYGGGVYVSGSFTMKGGTISGNKTYSAGGNSCGGGVAVAGGSFRMENGAIAGNTAGDTGGGVYVLGEGTFTMTGGTIEGNTALSGGGVSVAGGSFTMEGGTIEGNTASADSGGGGGVSLDAVDSTFTMTGGTIAGNNASGDSGYGGGVLASYGTFTMTGGTIEGNNCARTDGDGGGGVYAENFRVGGTPVVHNNVNGGKLNEQKRYEVGTTGAANDVLMMTFHPITIIDALKEGAELRLRQKYSEYKNELVAQADSGEGATYTALQTSDAAKFISDDGNYIGALDEQGKVKLTGTALMGVSADENGKVTARVYAPANSKLIAASYDEHGMLLGVAAASVGSANSAGAEKSVTVAKGYRYKLMLVDPSTFVPLCEAWDSRVQS